MLDAAGRIAHPRKVGARRQRHEAGDRLGDVIGVGRSVGEQVAAGVEEGKVRGGAVGRLATRLGRPCRCSVLTSG